MSNLATTNQKPSALAAMASRYNVELTKLLGTLKSTVFKNATDDQLMALVIVSNEYGLNPFLKEIYAFPDKGGGIVPVVGVDGWIKLMNCRANFDGIDFECEDKDGKPFSVTALIHLKDRGRPVKVTEYLSECSRNTDPWKTCPRRMLRHKALIQCSRVAFGFSGIHDEDDAELIRTKVVTGPVFDSPKKKPFLQISEEAARESVDAAARAEASETAPESSQTPDSGESGPSERATPLRAIENLCRTSDITMAQLEKYLRGTGWLPDSKDLGMCNDKKLGEVIAGFPAALVEIRAEVVE